MDLVKTGQYFYAIIEDEIVRVNSITTNSVSVAEVVWILLPKPHNAGATIYFASSWYGLEQTQRVSDKQYMQSYVHEQGREN